ncbi:arginase family protein [Roseiflexus castenholzii]|uniref:Arginase/agmatinase/formiminoglutamase n=1 Tax=Roseiflexus castenholzii (strain DSM 13941 / HLO8) TaxID=383372 RepID=A7NMZ3_ROSCS|nr:arginase family protein [Roseiflexus castenholzii]ABU58922.1 Arginase/agmatinase/formiminoglutamase [Roseiflexus castenholzii DSM 13941]
MTPTTTTSTLTMVLPDMVALPHFAHPTINPPVRHPAAVTVIIERDDMKTHPLTALQVIGVRYRGSTPAENDERALDAYAASGVYHAASVPTTISEPRMPATQRRIDEPSNLGWICRAIADDVAAAHARGRAPLIVGGDCTHAVGVVAGLQRSHGPNARIGLVWFDAHGDYNTPRTTLSGMLGGMPVAVCAGLALPQWRDLAGMQAPLPTDRIMLVDARNLDPPEEQLIRATETAIADVNDFAGPLASLAAACDVLYLHVDSDILEAALVPNHATREPDGPGLSEVSAAIDTVMATGKVGAFAVVSVYGAGPGSDISVASGTALIRAGLEAWARHGTV